MLFGQHGHGWCLRGIEPDWPPRPGANFGIKPVRRSTLAYADQHRTHELFKNIFDRMLSKCLVGAEPSFKNPTVSMRRSSIFVCHFLIGPSSGRPREGAVRAACEAEPCGLSSRRLVHVSTGQEHEIQISQNSTLKPPDVAVFDKGFTNYAWYANLLERSIYFVTRLKRKHRLSGPWNAGTSVI